MKRIIIVLLTMTLGISRLLGQTNQLPSYYTMTQEAAVIPHLTIHVNGGFDVIPRNLDVFRGRAKLGISDAVEIGILQEESVLDFFAVPVFIPQLELKLRILEGSRTVPAVSIAYKTSLLWKQQDLTSTYIGTVRPEYANQGLRGSKYDVSVSTGILIISQELSSNTQVTAGLGIQEIQTKSLRIYAEPAPFSASELDAKQELVLSGFLQAFIRLTDKITVFGEAQTLPAIWPNLNRFALDYDRVYLAGLGARYLPLSALAIDVAIHHRTAFQGISGTQVKLAFSSLLNLNP